MDIPKDLAAAAAHGDLRENAEYQAAKEKQAFSMTRLRELDAEYVVVVQGSTWSSA